MGPISHAGAVVGGLGAGFVLAGGGAAGHLLYRTGMPGAVGAELELPAADDAGMQGLAAGMVAAGSVALLALEIARLGPHNGMGSRLGLASMGLMGGSMAAMGLSMFAAGHGAGAGEGGGHGGAMVHGQGH